MSADRPAPPVPTSPQDRDPPGRPADVRGIDLNAPAKPDAPATEPHLPHRTLPYQTSPHHSKI